MHCALRSENFYINEFKLDQELYDNYTLLCESYEPDQIVKALFKQKFSLKHVVLIVLLFIYFYDFYNFYTKNHVYNHENHAHMI